MRFDKETAIVALGAGEPRSPEGVESFLRQILSDKDSNPLPFVKRPFRRVITETTLAQQAESYQRDFAEIGVDSPLHRVCGAQADGLADFLGCEGYVAMHHGEPGLTASIDLLIQEGMKRVVLVPMDPHPWVPSEEVAIRRFEAAWIERGMNSADIVVVSNWAEDGGVLGASAAHYRETLDLLPDSAPVILVAKDPGSAAQLRGSTYEEGVRRQASRLAENLNLSEPAQIGWMSSRLGASSLNPTVEKLIEVVAANGAEALALVPFGWVSDRFDTLCGIDMMCGRLVRQHKLRLYRVPTVNDRQEFLRALAAHIAQIGQGKTP